MDKRPTLNTTISIKDFKEFYWLKKELVDFCKAQRISTSGGKLDLAQRIEHFLITGDKIILTPKDSRAESLISSFDWNNEELSLDTIITDNYKNSECVRQFFTKEIGPRFKFNVVFMNWMKNNSGKNLNDAVSQWLLIESEKKRNPKAKEIAPQFEYNRYLRDFLADNPNKSRDIGIQLWNIKKTLRGNNSYSSEDLDFLEL